MDIRALGQRQEEILLREKYLLIKVKELFGLFKFQILHERFISVMLKASGI